jgi:hypothetical protein
LSTAICLCTPICLSTAIHLSTAICLSQFNPAHHCNLSVTTVCHHCLSPLPTVSPQSPLHRSLT